MRKCDEMFRAAVIFSLIVPAFAQAAAVISQSTPFVGITRYDVTDTVNTSTGVLGGGGTAFHYELVKVDTLAAGISFVTTSGNGGASLDTATSTTSAYVSAAGAAIGVNGGYFNFTGSSPVDLISLAVSAGSQVSPWAGSGDTRASGINISAIGNVVTFLRPSSYSVTDYSALSWKDSSTVTLYNAIGSNYMSVRNGAKTGVTDDAGNLARTSVGVKGTALYFFTVDNSSSSVTGLTPVEVGTLLHDTWGLTDVLNLDGGGSTQMAMRTTRGVAYINTPESPTTPRAVGNNLAVKATSIAASTFNILDDFEATDATSGLAKSTTGHFASPVGSSGSNSNVAAASSATRVTTQAHTGAASMQLSLTDSSTTSGFTCRLWSGGAKAALNTRFDSSGYLGYWIKTATPNLTTAPVVDDDFTGAALEVGTNLPLLSDNQWHLYSWNLNDATQWSNYAGGDGTIGSAAVTLDSLLFQSTTPENATVYFDDVGFTETGAIPVPEPAALATIAALALPIFLKRTRSR